MAVVVLVAQLLLTVVVPIAAALLLLGWALAVVALALARQGPVFKIGKTILNIKTRLVHLPVQRQRRVL